MKSQINVSRKQFDNITLILALVFYRLLLDYSYLNYIVPSFSSIGMIQNIDPVKLVESYIVFIIILLIIPKVFRKPSDYLIFVFFMVLIVPLMSYYGLNTQVRVFFYMMISGFLIVTYTVKYLPSYVPKKLRVGNLAIILLIGTDFLVLLWLTVNGGFSSFNLDFSKVYDFRRGEVVSSISVGIWSYVNVWVYKVINPILIAIALMKKKYPLIILFVVLQVIYFGISSHKSVFFFGLIPIVLYKVMQYKKPFHATVVGVCVLIVSAIFISLLLNDIFMVSLLVRRTFYTPVLLNFAYYNIFSEIGYVYFSSMNVLNDYLSYPFQYSPVRLVSYYLYGHPNTTCNTNFLATSYMQLGYCGVVLYSVIASFLLWLADMLSQNLPKWFAISVVFAPFISLFTSADLFTAMLTHGLLLSLLFLWILGGATKKNNNGELLTNE